MPSTPSTQLIYQDLLQHCQPYVLDGPFGFLTADPGVYRVPDDMAGVIAALLKTHPEAALQEAGVACRDETGDVVPTPALRKPGSPLIPFRHADTGVIFDLLTAAGCLSSELPLFAAAEDRGTREMILAQWGVLVLALDVRQVVLLRACGIGATLASGLERIDAGRLVQLRKTFGEKPMAVLPPELTAWNVDLSTPQPSDEPVDFDALDVEDPHASGDHLPPHEIPQPQVVDWTLAVVASDLERLDGAIPPRVREIARHLRGLSQVAPLHNVELDYWQLTEEELEGLTQQVQQRNSEGVRTVLEAALERCNDLLLEIDAPRHPKKRTPDALPTDLPELLREVHSTAESRSLRHEALQQELVRRLDQQLFTPAVDAALAVADPLDRLQQMMGVQMAIPMQKTLMEIASRLLDERSGLAGANAVTQLRELLPVIDRILRLLATGRQRSPAMGGGVPTGPQPRLLLPAAPLQSPE